MHVCQELHFHYLFPFSLACIAPASVHIKRKMLGLKAPHLTQRLLAVQLPDLIVCLDISNGIAAGGFTYWVLIHHFYLRKGIYISLNGPVHPCFFNPIAFQSLKGGI